jgi:hypothetical protein
MLKPLLTACSLLVATTAFGTDQATVRVETTTLHGPRPLEKQTEAAVIRDYLQAWKTFGAALDQNRVDLLDQDFVGTSKDKLTNTIRQQSQLGIRTRYQDKAHDLQIVFYSPEGLSIQLVDNVEYDLQVVDHDKTITTQRVHARYIAILTPSEVRWRVRIFQAVPES